MLCCELDVKIESANLRNNQSWVIQYVRFLISSLIKKVLIVAMVFRSQLLFYHKKAPSYQIAYQ